MRSILSLITCRTGTATTRDVVSVNCSRSASCLAMALLTVSVLAASALTARGQESIAPGENKDGAVQAGKTNSYTFAVTAGDRIVLQAAKLTGGAGFAPYLQLFSPGGTRIASQSGATAARLNIQAIETGTYSVGIGDLSGAGAGTYRLQLVRLPGAVATPANDEGGALVNGETHKGTIDVGDLDAWTINAKAGDRLVLLLAKVAGGAGFTPMLELFGPDGARLSMDAAPLVARLDIQVAVPGSYTALVSDVSPAGSGGYELRMAQLPGEFTTPAGDEGGPLVDSTDREGTITIGDLDLWSFTVDPSSIVTVQVTETSGGAGFTPRLEVIAPGGERKGLSQDASAPAVSFASEVGGTYTVLISDGARTGSGGYRVRMVRASLPVSSLTMLTSGSTYTGEIASAREDDQYGLLASAGETIVLRVAETTAGSRLNPQLRLFDPSGAQLASQTTAVAADIAIRATNSGIFTVSVRDNGGTGATGGANTGGYTLSYAKTGSPLTISPNDEGGPLINGALQVGSIDVGDLDAFNFTANAGETIIVRMGEATASLTPQLRLFDPSGTQLDTQATTVAAEVSVRATNSGTFLLIVGDLTANWAGSGNYRLNLAKTGSAVTVSANDEGGPMTNGLTHLGTIEVGDMDTWTINANAGDQIVVRMGESTSTLTPQLRLFDPSGAQLDVRATAVAAEVAFRATNSGSFLLVAADQTANWAGTGNYRLTLAKTGAPVTISPDDEGGAMTNGVTHLGSIETGDLDAWTIEAKAGESIVVRMGETTPGLSPQLRLFDPSGVELDTRATAFAAEVTARATNSGSFLLVAGDLTPNWAGTGNYRLTMVKTGSGVTISAQDDGGNMVNGTTYRGSIELGDIDAWTFNARAGETLIVRMGEVTASTLSPQLRIFDPSGAPLDTASGAAAAEVFFRATNSGPYIVIAGDVTANWAGTGDYRIVLAKTGSAAVPAASEEGGPMTGSGTYEGTLEVGALDTYTFTACVGETITLNLRELVSTSSLSPWLRLYGRDGVELRTVSGASTVDASIAAPASGTYTVVVGDRTSGFAGSGGYRLTATGLSHALRVCLPRTHAEGFTPTIIGGTPNGAFTLLTTTQVDAPAAEWTTSMTSQFDEFGVFTITDKFDILDLQRYFRVRMP